MWALYAHFNAPFKNLPWCPGLMNMQEENCSIKYICNSSFFHKVQLNELKTPWLSYEKLHLIDTENTGFAPLTCVLQQWALKSKLPQSDSSTSKLKAKLYLATENRIHRSRSWNTKSMPEGKKLFLGMCQIAWERRLAAKREGSGNPDRLCNLSVSTRQKNLGLWAHGP